MSKNIIVYFLENIALKGNDITLVGISNIEVNRTATPDNICNWQVFDDDDLLKFIQCIAQYETQEVDFNPFVKDINGKDIVFGNEVVQLKTNKIPKGLVALEKGLVQLKTNKIPKELNEVVQLKTNKNNKYSLRLKRSQKGQFNLRLKIQL